MSANVPAIQSDRRHNGSRCTPAQVDEIIRLRLQGVRPEDVAERVGVHVSTVCRRYRRYLTTTGKEQSKRDLAQHHAESITRWEQALASAWEAWISSAKPEYLAAYQRAAAALDDLRGLKAAAKVELTGKDGEPVAVDFVWREEVVDSVTDADQ